MKKRESLKDKSLYWKNFPDQYSIDENGKVLIHDDADEEVKKSYKQYSIEQMMSGYFVEEEDEEEEVERTFSVNEEVLQSLTKKKNEKFEIPEMHLKKDYSMYSWMSMKQYYTIVDGEYIFKEDTPEEVLEGYRRYKKQLKRIDNIAEVKGSPITNFLLESTGLNHLFKQFKKKKK